MGANILLLLFLSLSLLICFRQTSSSSNIPQSYVVYMGGSIGETDIKLAESAHLHLLKTVIPREEEERIKVKHVYHHSLRGFSALLTEKEASLLSGHEEVISVFRDPILKLHTTRSWDFLDEQSGFKSEFHYQHGSSDVIIGVVDTGIWPESPSFSDRGIRAIPRRWKGVCMESSDFNKSNCNRKLIGARHYGKGSTARDLVGHGTHTASTAAGALVPNASYHGLAQGTARGGLPSARIAVYKPCGTDGCSGSQLMKAVDDAVKDGVDIISISIGPDEEPDYLKDPVAIAGFHANQFGKFVICSAGNAGPDPYTVVNTAPWIFTVAASTIDRVFESKLVLGNKASFKGYGISFSKHTTFGRYPIGFSGDVASESSSASEASNCYPGSLDSKKVAGKIIVCLNTETSLTRKIKMLVVQEAGGRGVIYISDAGKYAPVESGTFPFTQVGENDGVKVLHYINSTKKATATIMPSVMVERFKPTPIVAEFSSRGPGKHTQNILKPDIMAPGVAILAALPPSDEEPITSAVRRSSSFGLRSGTSMACPHVSGAAAFIKSVHHLWTPSMIKSALMTTAISSNNERRAFTNSSGEMASPHEAGVGEISPVRALDPGLVFPTTTQDYLHFLCYFGYSKKDIKSISSTSYECPKMSKKMFISKINYPSISIGKLKRNHGRKITRHVVNVGSPNSTYVSTVHAPKGLSIKVYPETMTFHEGSKTSSFSAYVRGKQAKRGYNYGSIIWCDGKHIVRMVFAINIVG
ncbi:hypothetical protein RND81_09G206900 [Saponaria officinalis]|uniref:Uncharacterized protein n=1 Tax=Saponaria officinalis TaxID=3572 RepID=A0AAW1IP90_SAPOF